MNKEKISIVIIFIILPFLCFSQEKERVHEDALLHHSIETKNHNHTESLLADSVKVTIWRDYSESAPSGLFCHIIENKSEQNLFIFFIEEENDTLSDVRLLRRKLLRRYGDFSLSMIEWEGNMYIEKSPTVTPELFVKILKPEEKFEVVVPFANDKEEQIASEVFQHLLVCSEALFSSDLIGMPHYMENLQYYNMAYPHTKVVISTDMFKSFMLNINNFKKRRTAKSR